jgi:hypothetical protein
VIFIIFSIIYNKMSRSVDVRVFNKKLSTRKNHPSLQSAPRIVKRHQELATDVSNITRHLYHNPPTPAPTKKGAGVGQRKVKKEIFLQLGDGDYMAVLANNLGLGAQAGKHYISL